MEYNLTIYFYNSHFILLGAYQCVCGAERLYKSTDHFISVIHVKVKDVVKIQYNSLKTDAMFIVCPGVAFSDDYREVNL